MPVTEVFTRDEGGRQFVGRQVVQTGILTLTGTYDTGGFVVAASDFGMSRIDSLDIQGAVKLGATTFLVGYWDAPNSKIMLGEGGATANDLPFDEIDNGNSVTGAIVRVSVAGAG